MPADPFAADRPYRVTITPAAGDPPPLLLAGLTGGERVNELFDLTADLLAPLDREPVRPDSLLGRPVHLTLRVPGGDDRHLHGLVAGVEQLQPDAVYARLRVEVRPAWWPASVRTDTRAFQQQTVRDILQAVLGPFGPVAFRLSAADPYPRHNYTVQYRETDWAFARRLMEGEGLFCWFEHAADGHTLVVADGVAACPPAAAPVRFTPDATASSDQTAPLAWRWDVRQRLGPTAVAVNDSHFELFGRSLLAEAQPPAAVRVGDDTVRRPAAPAVPVYDPAGVYAKRHDGVSPGGGDRPDDLAGVLPDADRTARLRAEQAAADAVTVAGETNTPHPAPGQVLAVTDHPAAGKYIVTRLDHALSVPATYFAGGTDAAVSYRNTLAAVPAGVPPRPPVGTPRPVVGGVLTAVVTGPPGQEIFVDRHGRVKVQFAWDRTGQRDADSSCWVRVAQLWAGNGWGAFFWPRVGMEVVVAFEGGDPDRPLVVGCVYNAVNRPPTALPAEASVGGVKSHIVGGDPATQFNALYIHDTPGVEYIQLHSERSEVQQTEADRYHYAGGMTVTVQGSL